MVKYKAPLREYEFVLREVLQIERELGSYPEYSEATWDMIEMISEQFGKINEDYWLPSAKEITPNLKNDIGKTSFLNLATSIQFTRSRE